MPKEVKKRLYQKKSLPHKSCQVTAGCRQVGTARRIEEQAQLEQNRGNADRQPGSVSPSRLQSACPWDSPFSFCSGEAPAVAQLRTNPADPKFGPAQVWKRGEHVAPATQPPPFFIREIYLYATQRSVQQVKEDVQEVHTMQNQITSCWILEWAHFCIPSWDHIISTVASNERTT